MELGLGKATSGYSLEYPAFLETVGPQERNLAIGSKVALR